jgi:hypothetical protein
VKILIRICEPESKCLVIQLDSWLTCSIFGRHVGLRLWKNKRSIAIIRGLLMHRASAMRAEPARLVMISHELPSLRKLTGLLALSSVRFVLAHVRHVGLNVRQIWLYLQTEVKI